MDTKDSVFFFTDNSKQSLEAENLLLASKIPFEKFVEDKDYKVDPDDPIIAPTVIGVYGQFMGIKALRRYIALWIADPTRKEIAYEGK